MTDTLYQAIPCPNTNIGCGCPVFNQLCAMKSKEVKCGLRKV